MQSQDIFAENTRQFSSKKSPLMCIFVAQLNGAKTMMKNQ